MATRVVSKTIDLGTPIEEISKYITDITDAGIQIHPKQWNQNTSSYIQLDGDGFSVFNGIQQIAQYGKDAIIGDESGFHIKITANYYFLSSDTSVIADKTYYIRSGSGTNIDPYIYTVVDNPTGNPHTNNYYERESRLSFYRDNINEVAYISGGKLYITQSVVLQQMDVGRLTGEIDNFTGNIGKGLWSWKVHEVNDKNNFYLKWLG